MGMPPDASPFRASAIAACMNGSDMVGMAGTLAISGDQGKSGIACNLLL